MPGRTINGALEAHIAKTAIPPFGDGDDFTWGDQFKQHLTCFSVGNDGAHGHFQGDVVASSAKHVRAHTMLTALGVMTPRKSIIHQRIQVGICYGEHMPAAPTVTAIGTTEFFVFFMPKRDAASAAISG